MKTIISGRIRTYDEEKRIISIKHKNKVKYYYMQRSLLNTVSKYITVSRFIQFTVTESKRMYKGHLVETVDYIVKIMEIRYRKNIIFYDIKNIKDGTRKLLNQLEHKLFLDLEMSMHPYYKDKSFKQEIIQVGMYLVDKHDNEVLRYNEVITPTVHKKLTKRTLKFLEITQDDVDNGIPFDAFYETFHNIVKTYNPAIIVWGRNDFLALDQGYKINKLKSLKKTTRFINLLQIHKNYFNLKNDLGLFNALGLYQNVKKDQAHNAFEDAYATYQIFKGFRKVVNGKRKVKIKNFK
jgi:sporulation inhibitor KapD